MKKCCVLILLLCAVSAAQAQVFTWVDAQGVRHYSDSAPASGAKRAKLPGLQKADGNPEALDQLRERAASQRASEARSTSGSRTPTIVSPQPEQTFRGGERVLPVSIRIGGAAALRDGEQITYYLDGSPIPQSPIAQTQLELGNVPRGAHTLSAALLYDGKEVGRSAPVTFYMKPPSAISPLNSNPDGSNAGDTPAGTTAVAPAGNSPGAPSTPRFNNITGAASTPSAR